MSPLLARLPCPGSSQLLERMIYSVTALGQALGAPGPHKHCFPFSHTLPHFNWQHPFSHASINPLSIPGLSTSLVSLSSPLSFLYIANVGGRREVGGLVTLHGGGSDPGPQAQLLHLVTGALHVPALGLSLDLTQPRGAQPLYQRVLCM